MPLLPADFSRFFGLFCSPSCCPCGSPVLSPLPAAGWQDQAGAARAGWSSASVGKLLPALRGVIIILLMPLDKPAIWHRCTPKLSGRQCWSMALSSARRPCSLRDTRLSAVTWGHPPWDALGWRGAAPHPRQCSAPCKDLPAPQAAHSQPQQPFAMIFNLRPSPPF